MPRVIVEKAFDYRPRRGLIRAFQPNDFPIVVSQAEADAIVTAGAGHVVETSGSAIPMKPRGSPRKKVGVAMTDAPEPEGE